MFTPLAQAHHIDAVSTTTIPVCRRGQSMSMSRWDCPQHARGGDRPSW